MAGPAIYPRRQWQGCDPYTQAAAYLADRFAGGNPTVVDAGCGSGVGLRVLLERLGNVKPHIIAIDDFSTDIQWADRFIHGDITDIRLGPIADCVICTYVGVNVRPRPILGRCLQYMKADALLFTNVMTHGIPRWQRHDEIRAMTRSEAAWHLHCGEFCGCGLPAYTIPAGLSWCRRCGPACGCL